MGFTSGGYTTGLGRAQFRKLETVASRLSHCDHFKPLFPAKWIISELPVIRQRSANTGRHSAINLVVHIHTAASRGVSLS